MRVTLSIRKTLEEQAAAHFEAAKKARRKLEGARATIARYEREVPRTQARVERPLRQRVWYDRFRWSRAPDGRLIVGGRDAGSNETILKKHVAPDDLVFHSEEPGSPFVLLKKEMVVSGQDRSSSGAAPEKASLPDARGASDAEPALYSDALDAAAQFTAVYSRAWKRGASVADIFWVRPEQVSKTPNTGESIGRGSFIIRGEKHFLHPAVQISLGLIDGAPASGAASTFAARPGAFATIGPGEEKPSDLAKRLVKKLGGTSDEWVAAIPPGGARLLGWGRGSARRDRDPVRSSAGASDDTNLKERDEDASNELG